MYARPLLALHLYTPPIVRPEPRPCDVEPGGVARTPRREEHDVGHDLLPGFQVGDRPVPVVLPDRDVADLLAQAERAPRLPELVDEGLHDLPVHELEEPLPELDDRDLAA